MARGLRIAAILLIAGLTSGCASAGPRIPPSDGETAIEAAANAWLSRHPGYRLATDADCNCAEDLAGIRSPLAGASSAPNYRPYHAKGDFNHDRVADAAYGVIPPGQPGKFSILIIDGAKAAKGRRADAVLDGPFDLGNALFFGPPANPDGGLMVGAFASEACSIVPSVFGSYRLECSES